MTCTTAYRLTGRQSTRWIFLTKRACSGWIATAARWACAERHRGRVRSPSAARSRGRLWPVKGASCCWPSDGRLSIPGRIRNPGGHSPSLSDPTGAQSSQSSTMPVTWCKAMYFSGVMKVSPSRGSCTSRSHPHFSHASGIHWRGSELVVMPASSQPAAAYPFGRIGQVLESGCISLKGSSSCRAATRLYVAFACSPWQRFAGTRGSPSSHVATERSPRR